MGVAAGPALVVVTSLVIIFAIGASAFVVRRLTARSNVADLQGTALADEKTRQEIRNLRYGWIATSATALIAVAIAVGGWVVQAQTTAADERQRDAQHSDETYLKFLDNLADGSATKRINSVTFLANCLKATVESPTAVCGDPRRLHDQRKEIIYALVDRAAIERDLAVQDTLRSTVAALGSDALPSVIAANRRAAYGFSSELGKVVGSELATALGPSEAFRAETSVMVVSQRADTTLDRIVERLSDETGFAATISHGTGRPAVSLSFYDDPTTDLSSVYRRGILDELAPATGNYTHRVTALHHATVIELARQVAVTGSLLVVLLRSEPPWSGPDLSRTIIPALNLSNIKLRGANLSHAVVMANLSGAEIEFSDLTFANFSSNPTAEEWIAFAPSSPTIHIIASNVDGALFAGRLLDAMDDWASNTWRSRDFELFLSPAGFTSTAERLDANYPYKEKALRQLVCKAYARHVHARCPWSLGTLSKKS